ncbi:hypothetical protein IVA98_31410 [Bradyrhizobium sp. 160]|uniref:hypothetical protein n=1 Tax=unclassified Bradyrhizobium TaxID=2631580 RepID=UPI001FFBE890|nr:MULTISPECIES: hypothetical protein [unclassified Bradyrhizobium]MCK1544976.1 hypothetical protein [Bradyrhizobium sp. 179]MCK1627545.1 hypothetical protein [Bradyrhizobium sp. 160]
MNGELFTLYVEKVLAQSLAEGEIMIFKNLRKPKGSRQLGKPVPGKIFIRGVHLCKKRRRPGAEHELDALAERF